MTDKEMLIAMVRVGDWLDITPLDTLPNFETRIKVQGITTDGFIYGGTETRDGKCYPFWSIKDMKIVKE